MEPHTFLLKNTQDITRTQRVLAKDDKVVLQQFVQNKTPKYLRHLNFFENLYVNIINHVQESTSRNIFCNIEQGEVKLSLVVMMQVYTDQTVTTLKENAIFAFSVHDVPLNFKQKF